MSNDFRDDMSQAITAATKNIKAWLGALQFAAYSTPSRARLRRHTTSDGKQVVSHVSQSPEPWFENTKGRLESALRNAEGALSNEWSKRRDPRHNGPDADEEFAHAFEDKVAAIAKAVLDTEKDLSNDVVRQSPAARKALARVKGDLKHMIAIYVDHFHEMTMDEREGSLLSLRAAIIDGDSRAL